MSQDQSRDFLQKEDGHFDLFAKATLLQDISDGLVASKELLKDAEQLHHESQARCLWETNPSGRSLPERSRQPSRARRNRCRLPAKLVAGLRMLRA